MRSSSPTAAPGPRSARRPLLVLGACLALALGLSACGRAAPRTVVLISLDTLRADQLGIYGNSPDVSPRIDALARQSVVFEQALSNAPWTLPAHMTMLTGLDPVAHGVKRADYVLSGSVTTLAEVMRHGGFQCGGFTDGGFVSNHFGFGQGFHVFDDQRDMDGGPNGMERIVPKVLEWLHGNRNEDIFLFVHTFDIHAPYQEGDEEVHSGFRARPVEDRPEDHELFRLSYMYQQEKMRIPEYGRMGSLLNDYDAGVHEADRGVGRILDELQQMGRLDGALVIVTSDHGESFADHGLHVGHGIGLTDDELHIPLVIKLPGNEAGGTRDGTLVDLTDILPTALDVFGLPVPPQAQGESLAGLVRGVPRRRDYVFGQSSNTECVMLVKGGYKFISPPSVPPIEVARRHLAPRTPAIVGLPECEAYSTKGEDPVELHYDTVGDPLGIRDTLPEMAQLYDRRADPGERHNLFLERHDLAEQMSKATFELFQKSQELYAELDDGLVHQPRDPHQSQALQQLGYIGAEGGGLDPAALPKALRDPLANPYIPPDRTELDAADRVVHSVRLKLAEGRTAGPGIELTLQGLGDRYMQWGLDHPEHAAKVIWRIGELVKVGHDAGFELDTKRWVRNIEEQQRKLAASAGGKGAPAKAGAQAGTSPANGGEAGDGGGQEPPR